MARDDKMHLVAFMFTDGDSITWSLGNFLSKDYDWWSSKLRGQIPLAWTLQPALQELHPLFLEWMDTRSTPRDSLLAGPSGAGYACLDQFPSAAARRSFANWTVENMHRSGSRMLDVINQIQVGEYSDVVEKELVEANPDLTAVLVDEYTKLTIKGDARFVRHGGRNASSVVTSRRHVLSKTFGDLTPAQLVAR